jgi:hypothetical protein
MILALVLALAAVPPALPLLDKTVTIPAADWKAFEIPLRQRPARIECEFAALSGGSGVRAVLLERAQFERLEAGQGYHTLAATAYQRSGGLAYWAEAGDYVVAVDNRLEGRGPADVRLRVWLVFESPAAPPRTLSPERRAVVVGLSAAFFAGVALFAGTRLWRAFGASARGPTPPFPV